MKLSVVLCTYNGSKYIREQIDSIINQTRVPDEIIISDDGSSDGTIDILKSYSSQFPKIKFFENREHLGVNGNFYFALEQTDADLIAFSDQDDIWVPDKLEKQIKHLDDCWLCFHYSLPFFDGSMPDMSDFDCRIPNSGNERITFKAAVLGHTMLFKRELWTTLKNTVPNKFWDYFMYDTMFSIVSAAYGKTTYIPEVLVYHRRMTASVSYQSKEDLDKYKRSVKNAALIIKRFFLNPKEKVIIKSKIEKRFKYLYAILEQLDTPGTENTKKLISAYLGRWSFIKFPVELVKNRHRIFYSEERNEIIAVGRALLFNIMMYEYFR